MFFYAFVGAILVWPLGAGDGGGDSGIGVGGGGEGGGGDGGVADIDQTIDRYDYLIAFPHPLEGGARDKGRTRRGEVRSAEHSSQRRYCEGFQTNA